MRIHMGANSDGYGVAEALRTSLATMGHEIVWHASPALDEGDDYPGITIRTMQAVVADEDAGIDARGIIVGGSGAGEVVAANKVNGARVVSAMGADYLADARRHADVNGVVLPADHVDAGALGGIIAALVDTPFSRDIDDARRLVNVAEFETSGTIEGWTLTT